MSLNRSTRPRLHLEPLEDRFLLSAAALSTLPAERAPLAYAQYTVLPAQQYSKDTTPPVVNQPSALPQATDSDGDDYSSSRTEDHSADYSNGLYFDALALVRNLANSLAQQSGASLRLTSPAPVTPSPAAAAPQVFVPVTDVPVPHTATGQPTGTLDSPEVVESKEGDTLPPPPLVMVRREPTTEQDAEPPALPVEDSLLTSEMAPEPGDPLAGLLSLDIEALRRNADAFFARLADLLPDPGEGLSLRALAPWLLLGGAAAWEVALLPQALRRSGAAVDPLPGTEDEA